MDRFSIELLAAHPWRWALLLIPALCVAFWAYYRMVAPISRPVRWALWLLRGLAFLLVVFALWQPVATVVVPDSGRPHLAVLRDRSGSMALPGADPTLDSTRLDEVNRVARELEQELEDRFRLRWFDFGETLESSEPDSSADPSGSTSIGRALEGVLARSASEPINGIVLLSDGVNTHGRDPVGTARGSPVPIFTVAVGPAAPLPDLEIRRVETNPRAYAGEPLPMRAIVSTTGMEGSIATLEVLEKAEVRVSRKLEIQGGQGLEQEVRFELRPSRPGLTLYDVRVTAGTDAIPENNLRQVAVEVLERKTRVLCVADRIDWDFGFLRRSLDADTTLGYSYLVQTQRGSYRAYGERRVERLPDSVTGLQEFAAVVLVSTGRDAYPVAFLDALARFVKRGGGLFLIGEPRRKQDWAGSESFVGVLPGAFDSGARRGTLGASLETTPEGLRHPLTSIRENPTETSRLFAALPPVFRPRGDVAPKGGTKVLLRYRSDQGPAPALLASFAERGKVAWMHARGLWRWKLTASGANLPDGFFDDFAIGVVRWIAEPAIRDRFQVQPSKRVYPSGERVAFTASLWDASYAPVPNASVRVNVRSVSDTASALTDVEFQAGAEAGQYEARGVVMVPGEYAYSASVVDPESGRELQTAQGRFWVEPMGPEYVRTWSDRDALAQIANESGGATAELASLSDLVSRIPEAIRRIGRVREIEVWNHWALFALFVLVLSTEWFLRRRRGLA